MWIDRHIQAGFWALLIASDRICRAGSGLIQLTNFEESHTETKHAMQIMICNEYNGVCLFWYFVKAISEKTGIIGNNQDLPLLTWYKFNPTMDK